jgi:hypothetical protein
LFQDAVRKKLGDDKLDLDIYNRRLKSLEDEAIVIKQMI